MLIRAGFDIEFEILPPVAMILMLSLHPERMPTVRQAEKLVVEPFIPLRFYNDAFGNSCIRIEPPAGKLRLTSSCVVEDSGLPDVREPAARQLPVEQLPADTLQFLMP